MKILLREVFNLSRISLIKAETISSIAPRCFRRKQNQIKRKVWSSLSREYPLSENYFREEISGAAVFLQEMLIFGQTGNHNIIHSDNISDTKLFCLIIWNISTRPVAVSLSAPLMFRQKHNSSIAWRRKNNFCHSQCHTRGLGSAKSMYWSEACTRRRQGFRSAPAHYIAEQV